MLKINEIYRSIQGESTKAGLPCVFVRLTYCNLRCTYCDTEYAFYVGKDLSIDEVVKRVKQYNTRLVEITGGEPLFQDQVFLLMTKLADEGFEVMLETGGHMPIEKVDDRVNIIMDLKCPSSGMVKKNLYENLDHLKPKDELKFVIGSREDYDWSKKIITENKINSDVEILFSVVFGKLEPAELISWIMEDNLKVRFQLQMHKFIWKPDTKGV